MAKRTPADFFGHPDGVAPPFNKTPSNDPNYHPKLGNIKAMLEGPAKSRSDSPDVETLDGQFKNPSKSDYDY